jgi:hypothetical protein
MVTPFDESAIALDKDAPAKINKEAVMSFVLTCLRAGVRLDLKPNKSTSGLVAHVTIRRCSPQASLLLLLLLLLPSLFLFFSNPLFANVTRSQGLLDGLPRELKETGLAEDRGMVVLRERHKGNTWKAAEAIIVHMFKLLDRDNKGYIMRSEFKEFFLGRLHPNLNFDGQSTSASAQASSRSPVLDFNRVLQGARLRRQRREMAYKNRGGGSGCFVSGTGVMKTNGCFSSIDLLQLGDSVMAFDSEGTLKPASVRGIMNFISDKHYMVTLLNGSVIRATASHPVAVAPRSFVRVDALAEGDVVMVKSRSGSGLESTAVARVEIVAGKEIVYNLSTAPYNTFFASDVAVHNKGGGGGGGCFSGNVPVIVIKRNKLGFAECRRVCMRDVKAGDVIKGAPVLQC